MELFATEISNFAYVLAGKDHRLVGICEDPGTDHEQYYFVGDVVEVSDDGCGYITPGINKPGIGMIIGIVTDDTDHFFHVRMAETGEEGTCKRWRFKKSDAVLKPEERAELESARNKYAIMRATGIL